MQPLAFCPVSLYDDKNAARRFQESGEAKQPASGGKGPPYQNKEESYDGTPEA